MHSPNINNKSQVGNFGRFLFFLSEKPPLEEYESLTEIKKLLPERILRTEFLQHQKSLLRV